MKYHDAEKLPIVPQTDVAEKDADIEEKALRSQLACVGTSFESAREIFKLGNHYFGQALGYFVLDGFVTDHVKILQELSQMYRTLCFWERESKRAAAMMTRRVRMITPLLEQLNPNVYVAFWRQLSFEAAEMFQELYDLKACGKRLHGQQVDDDEEEEDSVKSARINELARKSIKFYGVFIESYHPNNKIPDAIETDHVKVYLTARLNRARFRTHMRGVGVEEQLKFHRAALEEYEWIIAYGARNPEIVTNPDICMGKEMELCQEMVRMLPSKLSRIAKRRLG